MIAGTDDLQPETEQAVYVLLDLDDLGPEAQLRPGHTIELLVNANQAERLHLPFLDASAFSVSRKPSAASTPSHDHLMTS